jgi:glycerophosphoryl diester phosphodiesterase
MNKVLVIGHRGAAGYAPENTLASFEKAIALGVDMIELDVHLAKTGELVVIHDKTVRRTTAVAGRVKDMTASSMQALGIPLLSEVFDLVQRRVKINIELKGDHTAWPVGQLIEHYVKDKGWQYSDFLVSSFDRSQLLTLYHRYPAIPRAALLSRLPRSLPSLLARLAPYTINMNVEQVTQGFIEQVHLAGIKLYVWTVNDPHTISQMTAWGVDGIFSDYPDRIIS